MAAPDSPSSRPAPTTAIAVFLGGILAVALCVVLYKVRAIFLPFIIGLFIAYVLDPALDYMEGRGLSRSAAVWTVSGMAVVVLVIVALLVVPVVVGQVQSLARNFGDHVERIQSLYDAGTQWVLAVADPQAAANDEKLQGATGGDNDRASAIPAGASIKQLGHSVSLAEPDEALATANDLRLQQDEDISENVRGETDQRVADVIVRETAENVPVAKRLGALFDEATASVSRVVPTALRKVGSFLLGSLSSLLVVVLVPIIAFHFLKEFDPFRAAVVRLVPERRRDDFRAITRQVNAMLGSYLRGLTAVCVLVAIASTAMLYVLSLLFGMEYALVIGLVTGLTYAVPYIGATLAAVAAGVFGYATADHHALLCGGLAVGLQIVINQIFDSIIMPRIVGHKVGMHPLLVIFALMAGFELWGIL
ncbi:MAG: AI-2E family transporter, partial [Armatimonadota bacterium]